jgi:hypothetical protein
VFGQGSVSGGKCWNFASLIIKKIAVGEVAAGSYRRQCSGEERGG